MYTYSRQLFFFPFKLTQPAEEQAFCFSNDRDDFVVAEGHVLSPSFHIHRSVQALMYFL